MRIPNAKQMHAYFLELGYTLWPYDAPDYKGERWGLTRDGGGVCCGGTSLADTWAKWLDCVAVELTLEAQTKAFVRAYRTADFKGRMLLRHAVRLPLGHEAAIGAYRAVVDAIVPLNADTLPQNWRRRIEHCEAERQESGCYRCQAERALAAFDREDIRIQRRALARRVPSAPATVRVDRRARL